MIPLEQGSVFRHIRDNTSEWASQSQSLWNRAVSSDKSNGLSVKRTRIVSIPLEQGSVFRLQLPYLCPIHLNQSQSLWNRAVSSDELSNSVPNRSVWSQSLWNRAVSSDKNGSMPNWTRNYCLNPFGTGQCLPTRLSHWRERSTNRLNPFGTGQCLPTIRSYLG